MTTVVPQVPAADHRETMAGLATCINPAARISVMHIGLAREPVVIIDDAMLGAERLIDLAATADFKPNHSRGDYPGIRADAPADYAAAVARAVAPMVKELFGLSDTEVSRLDALFSIVTTRPGQLRAAHLLPHIDSPNPRRLALLHFLGRGAMGGTAFFRQDATGFERVAMANSRAYRQQRRLDLERLGDLKCFPARQTPGYSEIAHLEARFNRLIIYRTWSLHSAVIPDTFQFSDNPRSGRLTANIFIEYDKAGSDSAEAPRATGAA